MTVDLHALLLRFERVGQHNGKAACPECEAFEPLDPANPRDYEQHSPDCQLGQAIAETAPAADAAPAEAEPADAPVPAEADAAEPTA
jgi:hypothetical protein